MGMGSIRYTDKVKTSFIKRCDLDGTIWIEAIAHADLTAKKIYRVLVNQYGHVTADMAQASTYYYIGAASRDCLEGERLWIQIGGICVDAITNSLDPEEGDVFIDSGGAVAYENGPYSRSSGQFGICLETVSPESTIQQIMLIPEVINFSGG